MTIRTLGETAEKLVKVPHKKDCEVKMAIQCPITKPVVF